MQTKNNSAGKPGKPSVDEKAPAEKMPMHKFVREIVETVAFVLVLVSVLRGFGAEAFEIPTGSMATTLHGTNKEIHCPECGFVSTVNARSEIDDDGRGMTSQVVGGVCQNCRNAVSLRTAARYSGDRVLVAKFLYFLLTEPKRWEVVVFKCPEKEKGTINYIKRLVGLPGETLRVRYGNLYIAPKGSEEFALAKKPAKVAMAVRRLVYDNDHQAADLKSGNVPPRWIGGSEGWTAAADGLSFTSQGADGFLTYRHIIGRGNILATRSPSLITDFESYNSKEYFDSSSSSDSSYHNSSYNSLWVGDLMIEADVKVEQMQGKLDFLLNKGARSFRCSLDLADKKIDLIAPNLTQSAVSPVTATGTYRVRFADFDDRLTVWVNDALVFGDGVDVPVPTQDQEAPTEMDLKPVQIHSQGAKVSVSKLRVYRDTYYTRMRAFVRGDLEVHNAMDVSTPGQIADFREQEMRVMAEPFEFNIPDGKYFMMGDNSPASQDSRLWEETSFVPEKMILGRAIALYWPPWNWTFVR